MIRKLLIANRGEIAVRIIRTCKERGIATVAVFSDVDRTAPHVLLADEARHLGPAPARESYLSIEKIIGAARDTGADAVHPGYGFLAENADFASRVRDAGITFIGPPPDAIRAMGDKTEARRLMRAAGVPIVPGTDGPVNSSDEALAFCGAHGYPVLLKAAAGGGGRGMRVVARAKDLAPSLAAAESEARSAFGDGRVYVERYLENPRHIEFQILADAHGSVVHLGERECSVQRRHQKVVEESPSVFLDDDLRDRMGKVAVTAARACGYVGAGTIEFLMDRQKRFHFLEMNTRLQVEHPVTELRTGIDLVGAQLDAAAGERLSVTQDDIRPRGHAIECRICAEDVTRDFAPETGTITHLRPASGPGVREDRGVAEGEEISVYYDSLIAKLSVWAATRNEALARMRRALDEYELLGVHTTIPLCRFVLGHPDFTAGAYDTHFLAGQFRHDLLPRSSENARAAAAVACAFVAAHRDGLPGHSAALQEWKSQRLTSLRS